VRKRLPLLIGGFFIFILVLWTIQTIVFLRDHT